MGVCVGRPVWGESDTGEDGETKLERSVWCVSTTLHRLIAFPSPSPPSCCYPVSRSVDLLRVSHFLFKKKASCLLLFPLLSADICWDRANGGKGWGMWVGWRAERRNYFWVILSWCYLKHFRVMRLYGCVCVCVFICVCENQHLGHPQCFKFLFWTLCTYEFMH